ncbi:hypothetical protein [Rhizobium sp. Root483D2]|uniref:hypothetical protein n=1 Tax=Rhizobium sp. Root483D2 TaxID=1736545 RepID=UPI00071308CB|nr:hypothetical protein [Rhizobium sp. Root483D2]KQY34163.1 hypothetical protein ASD32_23310 [Rhizobium sp. Root483D2]
MSDTKPNYDSVAASEHFQRVIRETFGQDERPAEIKHVAEVYLNMISILDIVFAMGQAFESMQLTSEQRQLFDRARGPLQSLMHGIGTGVTNLAPSKGEPDGDA